MPQSVEYDPLPPTNEHDNDDTGSSSLPLDSDNSHSLPQLPVVPSTSDNFMTDFPLAGTQPRFLGAALNAEGNRISYASDHGTLPGSHIGSDYDGSLHALNKSSYRDDPRDSQALNLKDGANDTVLSTLPAGPAHDLEEKQNAGPVNARARLAGWSTRRKLLLGLAALAALIIVIAVPVSLTTHKHGNATNNNASSGSGSSNSSNSNSTGNGSGSSPTTNKLAVTGGDGSTVTTSSGSTFTYQNSFGGTWYYDEEDPINNSAQCQSWTPPLNQTFQFGVDTIRGVNLGGWLVTEPFIVPSLYELYINSSSPAIDEWSLTTNLRADNNLNALEEHYKTFITEEDFAQIAGAGLNWVRIPIGYWAIETRGSEPFLAKVSWNYFLLAIQWARKYGIRINLDLHAVPGSQNVWNHSGKTGAVNFLNGPMGLANAQRTLDYIRILAEFISQPEYRDVVAMFSVLNEPQGSIIGQSQVSSFYLQAYDVVREASGTGTGNGPFIGYHDAFFSDSQWSGFMPGADRIALDTHPYICFGGQSDAAIGTYAKTPCSDWGSSINNSMANFGMTIAGEFSAAVTDCGLWLNGIGLGTRYDGSYTGSGDWPSQGSCTPWTDWQNYSSAMKKGTMNFVLASMDALHNWFFWTWKIGNSSVTGVVESPAWSYSLGLQQGWMPPDPRAATGTCGNSSPFEGPLQPYQTGGSGAGDIPASVTSSLAWPPATLSNAGAVTDLPSYTPTAPLVTLPLPTFSPSPTVSLGDGWANPADTAGMMTNIATCSYLDPWVGPTVAPPSPLCSGGSSKKRGRSRIEGREVPAVTPKPRASR